MRYIDEIIIHCSGTDSAIDVTAQNIHNYHKSIGFIGIGYHFYIRKDGTIEGGRPIETSGAHCKGHNKNSIGICYEGGQITMNDQVYIKDTRTVAQIQALYNLVRTLLHIFPDIKRISGHHDYSAKPCPCFDVHGEFDMLLKDFRDNALMKV